MVWSISRFYPQMRTSPSQLVRWIIFFVLGRINFQRSDLGSTNDKIPCSTGSRWRLDEICRCLRTEHWNSFTFNGRWADDVGQDSVSSSPGRRLGRSAPTCCRNASPTRVLFAAFKRSLTSWKKDGNVSVPKDHRIYYTSTIEKQFLKLDTLDVVYPLMYHLIYPPLICCYHVNSLKSPFSVRSSHNIFINYFSKKGARIAENVPMHNKFPQ